MVSCIESIRGILGHDRGGESKLHPGISISKMLLEVKAGLGKNNSSIKT